MDYARRHICLPYTLDSRLNQLRQTKVENLDAPVFGDEKIFRFEVAMDDAFLMRRRQARGGNN